MTKVKFCGLTRERDIEAVNRLLPDFIGFVFWEKSKRKIDVDTAKRLKSALDPKIKAVGVFVNEDIKQISKIANENIIDIVQLHGNEDSDYIKSLRNLTQKPIIQAVQVRNYEDIKKAEDSAADFILLDAGQGAGVNFDWNLAKAITRHYFLAGGLNISNVGEAVEKLEPFAVDVSSGIEVAGIKDEGLMREFMGVVRGDI